MKKITGIVLLSLVFAMVLMTAHVFANDTDSNDNNIIDSNIDINHSDDDGNRNLDLNRSENFGPYGLSAPGLKVRFVQLQYTIELRLSQANLAKDLISKYDADHNIPVDFNVLDSKIADLNAILPQIKTIVDGNDMNRDELSAKFVELKSKAILTVAEIRVELLKITPQDVKRQLIKDFKDERLSLIHI